MGDPVTIATWNVQAIRGATNSKVFQIAGVLAPLGPDIVALQEIRVGESADRIMSALKEIGLPHAHFSGVIRDPALPGSRKRYGNLIASRWPIEPVVWPVSMTWPQLLAAARLDVAAGRFLIVNAHIPNGSGNGWEKIYAFEALTAGIRALRDPVILVGDFNEPRAFLQHFTSFGVDRHGRLDGVFGDAFGLSYPRQRWQDAVVAVLATHLINDRDHWGGRLATRQLGVRNEPTHLLRTGVARYFDHVVAAPPFAAQAVTYDHSVRMGRDPISDHSLVIAALAPD